MHQSGLQILHDLRRNQIGRRQAVHIIEAVIFEPKDVQVDLVLFQQLVSRKALEAFALFA